jgi:Domain of unknown function (DUF4136)
MRFGTLAMAAGLALLAAPAAAQKVTYDFDKEANFSAFRTYAWVRGTDLNDELNHKRIVHAVDTQLAARGLTAVDAGAGPDVLVAYHASFGRDLQVSGFSSGWGGYRFGPARSGSARVDQILTGTLVVDVVDAKTGTIVWRGIASKDIDANASPEKREKNINKTAEKLFKNYPPRR